MDEKLIVLYVVCDECLKALGYTDDLQAKMSGAEVLCTAAAAAMLFGGNFWRAQWFLCSHKYMPNMLSKSRLNRRLHAFDQDLLVAIFSLIGSLFHHKNTDREYIVDSFPIPVCHNIRIFRCRIFKGEAFRGYCASKKTYFYGIKVHLVVTQRGDPVQFSITPGSCGDITGLKEMPLDLPARSILYGDAAYNDYGYEDALFDIDRIDLKAQRRSNSKRPRPPCETYLLANRRRRIETSISGINRLIPKRIGAVTRAGFTLKVFFFLFAFSIERLCHA